MKDSRQPPPYSAETGRTLELSSPKTNARPRATQQAIASRWSIEVERGSQVLASPSRTERLYAPASARVPNTPTPGDEASVEHVDTPTPGHRAALSRRASSHDR
jgi:hypothetical protein